MIANPTASLYNNRTQLLAAIEFACLDLHRAASSACRCTTCSAARCATQVPFASYLFFRYPADDGTGEVRTAEQLVAHARAAQGDEHGFTVHKLKGGVFPPDYELRVLPRAGRGVPRATGSASTRTARFSVEEAIRFGRGDRGPATTTTSRTRPGG